jgi:hypothetical protein
MKIINNIKDFDKIKVGYTLIMTENNLLQVTKILEISEKKVLHVCNISDGEKFYVHNIFNVCDFIDVVFPCSPNEVQELYPEYFI